MQKIHFLVKKALNPGFSVFRSRFPSRVTARKDKILVKGCFFDSVLKKTLASFIWYFLAFFEALSGFKTLKI